VVTEPAFAAMEDTPLFFVDIPGIDLSNKDCPYRSHVDENFHTFDAIILVLDSKTDAKKQKRMLRYIRRNRSRINTVPLIILGNERSAHIGDSPQLSDLEVQVDEMFDIQSSDRVLQLDCIMSSFCGDLDCDGEGTRNDLEFGDSIITKPVFVPVKLHDAFRYRLTSAKLNLDQVSKLGASTIDKICQDEIGKEVWEKLSKDDRLDIVHSVISTQTTRNQFSHIPFSSGEGLEGNSKTSAASCQGKRGVTFPFPDELLLCSKRIAKKAS
jgi:hypothetical protein